MNVHSIFALRNGTQTLYSQANREALAFVQADAQTSPVNPSRVSQAEEDP